MFLPVVRHRQHRFFATNPVVSAVVLGCCRRDRHHQHSVVRLFSTSEVADRNAAAADSASGEPVDTWEAGSLLDDGIYDDIYSNYVVAQRPTVLRGYASDWPATKHWGCPEYLLHVAGRDRLLSVERSDSGVFSYGSDYARTTVPLALALEHFAHCARASDAGDGDGSGISGRDASQATAQIYAAQLPIDSLSPTLRGDLRVPNFCFRAARDGSMDDNHNSSVATHLWLGRGARTPLHWDAADNCLVQLCGSKYCRLYSPRESRRLHPFDGQDGPRNASRVGDVETADVALWPGRACYMSMFWAENICLYCWTVNWFCCLYIILVY
jgi:hypothetical protein